MNLNTENGLHLMSRLRPRDVWINCQPLEESMVFVVDLSETDLFDTNVFIHCLCFDVLRKYSKIIANSESTDSLHEINKQLSSQQLVETQKPLYDSFDHSLDVSITAEDMAEDTVDDSDPLILVFDSYEAFDFNRFSKLIADLRLKDITIYKCLDSTQLLSGLYTELPLNLALNPNLKLVIIYVNSLSEFIIDNKIVDKINELLFSSEISVPIVLVVDKLSKSQSNAYENRSLFQVLTEIQLNSDKTFEIKTNSNDKTIFLSYDNPLNQPLI